jgi:hypothetical protein
MNLEEAVREVATELTAQHAGRTIEVNAAGDTRGRWDRGRLSQVLSNLMGNAIEHGARETPVRVTIDCARDEVAIAIHNHGVPIPASLIPRIFDPMKRRQAIGRRTTGASRTSGSVSTLPTRSWPRTTAASTSNPPRREAPRSPSPCRGTSKGNSSRRLQLSDPG